MESFSNWLWSKKSDSTTLITKKSIENVCFKGGGMKGNAFVGVDQALTELGVWPQIKRFIGSSAGAIFAGAAACRIPYKDMAETIENTDFSKFQDSNWGIAGEGVRLIEYFGLYEGAYFYNWYGDLLEKYVGDKTITLQGVYEKYGTELVITTTDLTEKKLVYMNRHDNPDLQVRDAVRRSMSIPVFYVPVRVVDDTGLTHILVDGGCANNYPLNYFDDLYGSPEDAFGKTIGFDLEPQCLHTREKPTQINNIIELVTTLINTTIEVIEQVRLTPEDKYRSVAINTEGYVSTNFDMNKKDIQQLAKNGYTAAIKFFQDLEI